MSNIHVIGVLEGKKKDYNTKQIYEEGPNIP